MTNFCTCSIHYTLSSDDLMGFYTILDDVYVRMFWRKVLPSSSCQLNFFRWILKCLGREISSAVFWPFRALEKEEGIDLISNPMGTECCKNLNMVSCPRRLTAISASSNANSCHVICCWDCGCLETV